MLTRKMINQIMYMITSKNNLELGNTLCTYAYKYTVCCLDDIMCGFSTTLRLEKLSEIINKLF